jgi:hypothetical protein
MATAFKKFQQGKVLIRRNTWTKMTSVNILHTFKKSGSVGFARNCRIFILTMEVVGICERLLRICRTIRRKSLGHFFLNVPTR